MNSVHKIINNYKATLIHLETRKNKSCEYDSEGLFNTIKK